MAYRVGGKSSNPTLTVVARETQPSLAVTDLKAHTQVAVDAMDYQVPRIEGLVVAGCEPYQGTTRILGAAEVATVLTKRDR